MPHRFLRVVLGLTLAVLLLGAGAVPAGAAAAAGGVAHQSFDDPVDSDGDGIPDDTDQCPNEPGSPDYGGCPVPDSDGDGLPDDVDACPDLPGPYDGCPLTDLDGDGVYDDGSDLCPNEYGLPEYGGCPAPDSDGDGITDDVDACPGEYGLPEYNGCPYSGPGDSDGDGIADDVDQCPFEPGVPENYGCPYLGPVDSDGDGVYDDTDQCPNEPGSPDYGGCPVPDSDGDGLPDDVDACPDLPGPYDGCPLTDLDGDGVYDDGSDLCPNEYGLPDYGGCPAPDSDGDGLTDDVDQCDDTPPGTPIDGIGCSLPVVTATAPTFTDRCGRGQDTVTVPTSTGVIYRRDGNVVDAGTHRVRGTVTIVAEAVDGYVLSGEADWTRVMTNKVCPHGRLQVTSSARGKVRIVNREDVAMTLRLGSDVRRVDPGAARVFPRRSGTTIEWGARWKSPLLTARSGSVRVL